MTYQKRTHAGAMEYGCSTAEAVQLSVKGKGEIKVKVGTTWEPAAVWDRTPLRWNGEIHDVFPEGVDKAAFIAANGVEAEQSVFEWKAASEAIVIPGPVDGRLCAECGRRYEDSVVKHEVHSQAWGTFECDVCPEGHILRSTTLNASLAAQQVTRQREPSDHKDRQGWMNTDPHWRP